MYCDQDETVLTWDTANPCYRTVVTKHPWMLDAVERARVEKVVAPCPNGGRFAFDNPPLCPNCYGSIALLVPDREYFIVVGRRVDGDTEEMWRTIWIDT